MNTNNDDSLLKQKLRHECETIFYSNGKRKYDTTYLGNIKDGVCIEYYQNGNVEILSNYKNNELNGNYVMYFPNNTVRNFRTYENNMLHGKWISYYENNNKSCEFAYSNGEQNGLWNLYYTNGKLNATCNMLNSKYDGLYISYYESNDNDSDNIDTKISYSNGVINGLYEKYHKNGTLSCQLYMFNNNIVNIFSCDDTGKDYALDNADIIVWKLCKIICSFQFTKIDHTFNMWKKSH